METKITSRVEEITPEKAKEYLKLNVKNRNLRQSRIDKYARDMRLGFWVLNDQPISFNDQRELDNGQHRLLACIQSQTPFQTLVVRGVPKVIKNGKYDIYPMDTSDGGCPRSVGDQLVLRHGYKSGSLMQAAIQTITGICIQVSKTNPLTVPVSLEILKYYKDDILHCLNNRSRAVGIRAASVIGSAAFCRHAEREKIDEFYAMLVTGEAIHKGNPAYTLREHLLRSDTGGGSQQRWYFACAVCNAAKYYVTGEKLNQMKHTSSGIEFWQAKQKSTVKAVCDMFIV